MRELLQAYQESLGRSDRDAEVFRVALIERLVMVCDAIGHREGTGGTYRHEQKRG